MKGIPAKLRMRTAASSSSRTREPDAQPPEVRIGASVALAAPNLVQPTGQAVPVRGMGRRAPLDSVEFIEYRRLSMNAEDANTYSKWFACLADPSRIAILNLLASEDQPMMVGQIVGRSRLAQSTVSYHLKRLCKAGFVHVDHQNTASWYSINHRCIEAFPTAADVVMGRTVRNEQPDRKQWADIDG